MYYFADRKSVAQLGRFPQHREAKGQVARWYDGYRIVVSDVRATYGDGRLPAPARRLPGRRPDPRPGRRPRRRQRGTVMTHPDVTHPTQTRPDKHDFDTLTGNSWSVHGGNHADETTGAIRTPIVMANSYRLPEDPSDIDDPGYQGLVYTREHGANQRGLEEKLAKLDHGEAAAVFGTGMAALHAAFFTILNPGDHAIVSNVVYMRVAGLFTDVFPKKLGIEVDFVDITDLDAGARRRTTQHQARPHRGHRQPRPPRRRRPRPRGHRPRRRRTADHRLHLHAAADDAAPRPRRRPRHPLPDEVLQRSRRRDGRRRHRQPRAR